MTQNSPPLVSLIKTDDQQIHEATAEALDYLGGMEDLRHCTSIAIKPNLCCLKSPEAGATTDPRLVEAVIQRVRRHTDCAIHIVESNNSHASADTTFATLGYLELAQRYPNVKCVNLSRDPKIKVTLNGHIFSTILAPETLLFTDYLINIAKLKTHVDHRYSGVLKNTYGMILRAQRAQYHGFMNEVLTDLNTLYYPNLSLIDGIVGMEGFGPVDGTPIPTNAIIASKDPVAADAVGASIIGVKPHSIAYLRHAWVNQLGHIDFTVKGASINQVAKKYAFIPQKWYYLGRVSLRFQRWSHRWASFGKFLSMARSSLSTIGFSELDARLSYKAMLRLARDVLYRMDI
jgi:uncharacterized protein (DUF362 family)